MIPEKNDPILRALVTGEDETQFESFALKIMLGRMRVSTKYDASEENILRHVQTLHAFFELNYRVAKDDIAKIFSTGSLS